MKVTLWISISDSADTSDEREALAHHAGWPLNTACVIEAHDLKLDFKPEVGDLNFDQVTHEQTQNRFFVSNHR